MNTATSIRNWPKDAARLVALALTALAAGCLAAVAGLPSFYALISLAVLVIFAAAVSRAPSFMLSTAVWMLGLFPFSWGIQTGVLPKLFGDEMILLLYLAVVPALYLFHRRTWNAGCRNIILALLLFVFAESLSLLAIGHDLVAARNFIETFVLGPLLAVLFLQEGANAEPERLATSIVWLTAVIATLSIIERVVQRNPLMEHITDITYLSPELARLTNGVYRPYVSFFHPSETGTFMALGFPFAVRHAVRKRNLLATTLFVAVASGLLVNATRGVWAGVAAACLLLMPNALLFMAAAVPVVAVVGGVGYLVMKDTPFMQRLTDSTDLFTRFESWRLALKVSADHVLTGVGHMQFKEVYLGYVQDLSNAAHFDIAKVYVADNMYLTVLVEHGLIGLMALVGLFAYVVLTFRRRRAQLTSAGNIDRASYVRAAELSLVIYAVTGCLADVNLFTKATKFVFILVGLGFAASTPKLEKQKEIAGDEFTDRPS